MTEITKASRANLLPQAIQELEIDVPIYRVEETKTLLKFFVYGHSAPLTWKKPPTRRKTVRAVREPPNEEE